MHGKTALSASLALMLVTACAPKRVVWSDPSLPEPMEEVTVMAPTEVLKQGSASEDPGVRARAIGLLIRLAPSPAEGGWDQRALWDPDAWVQLQGVLALTTRLSEPQAVAALEGYVRRTDDMADPHVRGAAGVRLAAAGHKGAKDALHQAWVAQSTPWSAAPLQLAAASMGDELALAPLARSLTNADVSMEPQLLLDIGASGLDLSEALQAGDEWVEDDMRLAFAAARVQLGDKRASAVLRSAIEGDDPLAALEALDYASALPGEEGTKLLRRARSGGSELARTYADMALLTRGVGDVAMLDVAMLHHDREVRELAVRFATELAQPAEVDRKTSKTVRRTLKLALDDEDLAVRLGALRGLADLKLAIQGDGVEKHLSDELLAVRVEAAGALLAAQR